MFKKSKRRADNDFQNTQKRSLTKIIISIVIAAVLWIGAVSIESFMLSDKSTTSIVVANKTIKEGTVIDSQNQEDYFSTMRINSALVTKSTVTDMSEIKGKASVNIDKGSIISSNSFYDATYVNEKFTDPAEITFSAKDIENSVVGTLRKGDLIDIIVSKTDQETGSTLSEVIYSEVYVIAAYDENYLLIDGGNKDSQAVYFKIYLEREEETTFASLLNDGNITITKVK